MSRRSLLQTSLIVALAAVSGNSMALGECGLSCCLAGTSSSGVTTAENFGLSVQYEYTDMTTIRNGTDSVSPTAVMDKFWAPGTAYMVPTEMTMEKINFVGALPINERWQVIGIVPYVRNNMDMIMKMQMPSMPMPMTTNMEMDEVRGWGDVTLLAYYTAYTDAPIRPKHRLTLGMGLKLPTGKNDSRTQNGDMVHAMMQAGSGSWDPVVTANYMRAWYPVIMQVSAFYHMTTESDEGYEFGDQYGVDVLVRGQVSDTVNLGASINAIHTAQDKDNDGQYTRNTMLDDVNNTGLVSVLFSPSIQYKIVGTGGSLELKYQIPLHQDVTGFQQVLDKRIMANVNWSW